MMVAAEELLDLIRGSKAPTLEVAEAMDKLCDLGMFQKTIASQLGRSEAWISRMLKAYRGASQSLQDAWREGMPIDIVYEVAKWKHPAQEMAVEAYKRDGRKGIFSYPDAAHATPPPEPPRPAIPPLPVITDIPALETFLAARKTLPPYVLGVYHGLLLARGDSVSLKDEYHKVMRLAKRLER